MAVIEHDNLNYVQMRPQDAEIYAKYAIHQKPSRVSGVPPALRVGDPLHYSSMLQRICVSYVDSLCLDANKERGA